jgi:cobalamin biosynthesis protein CobT
MCDNISKHIRENPGATFGDNTKPNAVHVLGERYRKWDRWSEGTRARIDTAVPPDCKAIADALDKEGFGPKMVKARSTNQVFDLAKEMYKRLFPEDEKDPEDPKSDQNYQGESKEDEAKRKAKAGKPTEGEGKDGEGKVEGKGKPKVSVIPWTMLDSDHTETGTPNPNAKIDYSDHHYNRTQPLVMPITIRKPTSEQCSVPKAPSFIGRLRILLQSEKKCKFEFGLTSGKLDQRKLSKLALPIVPGSDSWRHVFKKRIPGKKINTCVQILVDGSGSMSGRKNEIAADAADIMNQAFAGPLRIKTAVHGFDAHSNNIIYPIKEFNENVLPGQIASRGRGVGFGGNADGDALLWGLGNIIGRPEKRKIIIVLSDGMPSSSSRVVDPGSMLKYAIDAARKRGVQVYGIGIEDDSVKHFYGKDCKVIKSAAELPQAIIDTLKAAV